MPWSRDRSLRLNPHNGLCLNALHDAAFDRGLITLSENLELILSVQLKAKVPPAIFEEMFETRSGVAITPPERFVPSAESLAYHRERVFRT